MVDDHFGLARSVLYAAVSKVAGRKLKNMHSLELGYMLTWPRDRPTSVRDRAIEAFQKFIEAHRGEYESFSDDKKVDSARQDLINQLIIYGDR